jgi:hypothetical protein
MRPYMWPSSGKTPASFGSRQMVPVGAGSPIANFAGGWVPGSGLPQIRGMGGSFQRTAPPQGWRGPPGHIPGVFRPGSFQAHQLRPLSPPRPGMIPSPGLGIALLPWLTGVGQYQPGGQPPMPVLPHGPTAPGSVPMAVEPSPLEALAAFAAQYQTGY